MRSNSQMVVCPWTAVASPVRSTKERGCLCDPGIRDEKARMNNKDRMHVMPVMVEYVHVRLF